MTVIDWHDFFMAFIPGPEAVPPALLHRLDGKTWNRAGKPDLLQRSHPLFCHDCHKGVIK